MPRRKETTMTETTESESTPAPEPETEPEPTPEEVPAEESPGGNESAMAGREASGG